ncbi:hypothetical protein [Polyangium fumosum]|uniref:Uncharacterized protein n=1 Tax=Polyangium fumosum TaxID=889272 RepID=A0A4V5PK15_9BACT|nr:hypothetical protein [Polyangium fumosum]TKC93710.1 hypothetical protein E8A74_49040 [Polyangium fumosum]
MNAWLSLDRKARARQFRALVVVSLRVAALTTKPVPLGRLGPDLYSTPERNAAGAAIARTLVLLAPQGLRPVSDIQTDEASPAQGALETGLIPVATVLLVTACALAAAYLATMISQAVHAVNFDDEVTTRLLAVHAQALEILSIHVERERVAGHELPFNEAERAWLIGLEDAQRRLATMRGRPLPSPFHGATQFTRAATGFGAVALVAVAVFLLMSRNNGRRS